MRTHNIWRTHVVVFVLVYVLCMHTLTHTHTYIIICTIEYLFKTVYTHIHSHTYRYKTSSQCMSVYVLAHPKFRTLHRSTHRARDKMALIENLRHRPALGLTSSITYYYYNGRFCVCKF